MRKTPWLRAEPYRVPFFPGHPYYSAYGDDFGMFKIPGPCAAPLAVIVSAGDSWDHVSVSLKNRCPNWSEMSFVKDLFFDETETVMQLHVPADDHVNCHPYCLHLWRPHHAEIPRPEAWMVGPKA